MGRSSLLLEIVQREHSEKVLYNMRTRGSDQIANSTSKVRTRNQSRSIEAEHVEETHRSKDHDSKFKVRNEGLDTRVFVKTQNGRKLSALKGKWKNAINGKHRTVFSRRCVLAVSVTTTVGVERQHNRPLLL